MTDIMSSRSNRGKKNRTGRRVGLGVGVVVIAVLLIIGVLVVVRVTGAAGPLPGEERCVGRAGGNTVAVDLDQAHYASVIVGLSVRRDLPPRAGSIAMATVYQESDIRNLDYGDRDSIGLFQQRPSQGWGSEKQLLDPYYSTGKFYDALVKIHGWQDEDITTIAQKIQVSGHPDAYRDHEQDGRVLASTLAGETHASFSCLVRGGSAGQPAQLKSALSKTFGVKAARSGSTVTIKATSTDIAWAYAHFCVANAKQYGVTRVELGGRSWTTSSTGLPSWVSVKTPGPKSSPKTVTITLR